MSVGFQKNNFAFINHSVENSAYKNSEVCRNSVTAIRDLLTLMSQKFILTTAST